MTAVAVVTAEGQTPLEAARAVKAAQQSDKRSAWRQFLKDENAAWLAIHDEASRKAWAALWHNAPPYAGTTVVETED